MTRKALCALRSRLVVAMAVGLFSISIAHSAQLLIPMDDTQSNHLKAYGLAYWLLEQEVEVEWLLNYRGGSFLVPNLVAVQQECVIRGISHQVIADVQASQILTEIAHPESNTERVKLEVAPKSPSTAPMANNPGTMR